LIGSIARTNMRGDNGSLAGGLGNA
jgi:hypothetical protein